MSKITRTDPGPVLSKVVEYHNFVYLQGCTAQDLGRDVSGQTEEVLAQIDALLEAHGTDKTRLLQAQIWLKDIRDRDAMNKLWSAWLPPAAPRRGPACRRTWPIRATWWRSWSPPASDSWRICH